MEFEKELNAVIKKKALGFSYTEETLEYETVRPKAWIFCEKRRRLLNKNGFIAVDVILKQDEILGLERKKNVKLNKNGEVLTPLKAFKIKG